MFYRKRSLNPPQIRVTRCPQRADILRLNSHLKGLFINRKSDMLISESYAESPGKAIAQQHKHPEKKENEKGITLCSSYAFDAFCNRRPLFIEYLASAIRTLHPDVFHIELHCFLTQTTLIPGHFDSSSTGNSTGSPLRIRSAVTPEGVFGI